MRSLVCEILRSKVDLQKIDHKMLKVSLEQLEEVSFYSPVFRVILMETKLRLTHNPKELAS